MTPLSGLDHDHNNVSIATGGTAETSSGILFLILKRIPLN